MAEQNQFRTEHGMDLRGEVLGSHYLLEEKVGQGGMAWVYRATHRLLGGSVAVKVLFPHLAESENIRTRFLREAQIQYQLEHPNIVRVLDFIDERGLVGFVSEWCSGGDLVEWMKAQSHRPLRSGEIRSLLLPVVEASHIAHEHGVVHRDLKPHNVMLHQRGEILLPKLTDFGVAKQLAQQGLTATGMVVGTVHYMSPEQLYESKSVDHRTDIYSLGVILYQMLSGVLPFRGETPSLFMKILEHEPPPIENITGPLHDVLQRCLAKNADDRFASCVELRAALDACLEPPLPVVPPGQSISERAYQQALMGMNSGISSGGGWSLPGAPARPSPATPNSSTQAFAETGAFATAAKDTAPETEVLVSEIQSRRGGSLLLRLAVFLLVLAGAVGAGSYMGWIPLDLQKLWEGEFGALFAHRTGPVRTTPPLQRRIVTPPLQASSERGPGEPVASDAGPPEHSRARQTPRRTPPRRRQARRTPPSRRVVRRRRPRRVIRRTPPRRVVRRRRPRRVVRRIPPRRVVRRSLRRQCREGVGRACYALGNKELGKKYWAIDYKRVRRLFGRACHRSEPKACAALARLWYKGQGGRRSYRRARRLFWRACKQRVSSACRELGWILQKGFGGRPRHRYARRMYQRACEMNDSVGCNLLGVMHRRGMGGPRNFSLAKQAYQKACKMKNKVGCYNVGVMHQNGWGLARNGKRALSYYKKACAMKFGQACLYAARMLWRLSGASACSQINVFLRRSCALKYRAACRETCSSYQRSHRPRSWLEAP